MQFVVIAAEAGHTLAKVLRSRLHESKPSWNDVRSFIEGRRVKVGDGICTDTARRLKQGDCVEFLKNPLRISAITDAIVIRHLDEHVVVVEKPSGISSVRHPAELAWSEEKRRLDPTLQDLTRWAIARAMNQKAKALPPLRIVHRLDRDTSGLLVFARSPIAEKHLGSQFRKHTVIRRYLAIVPGYLKSQTLCSTLIRDRGDGRRGSTNQPDATGKVAITHIAVEERLKAATVLSCRLETGRTHQIRIHLAESGHPVAGEKVYVKSLKGVELPSLANAPRLALHAIELGFKHPVRNEELHWLMPLPFDLASFVKTLRGATVASRN